MIVAYTRDQAVKRALAATSCDVGMCLAVVRGWLGVPAKYGSAATAWDAAKQRSSSRTPPAGVPVFWLGGRHGHIALSLGGGRVRSTDWPRGKVGTTTISELERRWGYRYVGWSSDLNGVKLPTGAPARPPAPAVRLADLKYGLRNDSVKLLQLALIDAGFPIPAGPTGNYGLQTDNAVRAHQRSQGWRADAAGRSYVGPQQAAALKLKVAR